MPHTLVSKHSRCEASESSWICIFTHACGEASLIESNWACWDDTD